MTAKGSWLDVGVICLVFILLSIVGLIWDVASGLLTSGIDGIMLAAVCLMVAGIFSLMLLMVLHQAGLLPKFVKKSGEPKAEATPAKPPAPPSAPAKSPASAAPAATQPTAQGK